MLGNESKGFGQELKAHQHARKALSYLLDETWSYDVLRLVRDELGQAYCLLKKHLKSGSCTSGHGKEDIELYRTLLILVNSAIANESLRPIPVVVDQLKNKFSSKKQTHCIQYTSKDQSVSNG